MAKKMSTTEQIGMWLAKADATEHAEEKKLFMERAQQVAARNSIDLAVARASIAKMEEREKPTHRHLVLGQSGQRALAWYVELMTTIAHVNDIRCTIARNSTYINLYGMPSDIEVTEAIYATAITAMVEGGDDYVKNGDYKSEVLPLRVKKRRPNPWYTEGYSDEPKFEYYWTTEYKPISGMTARQNFYKGFVSEIGSRLRQAKNKVKDEILEQAAKAENVAAHETSTALVLRSKGKEVGEYYDSKVGKLRGSWNGSKSPVHSSTASGAGRNHAKGVDLGGRKALPGSRTAISN